MISGNLLPIIAGHVGPIDDTDALLAAYDAGELTQYLADGCWWRAETDADDRLLTLEHESTAEAARLAGCSSPATVRDGGLLILSPTADDSDRREAKFFPACEAAERLAAIGAAADYPPAD